MDFEFTAEEKRFRDELREFLSREATRELSQEFALFPAQGWGPHLRKLILALGSRRWLAPDWAENYGGLGGTRVQKLIVKDELGYFGFPTVEIGVGANMAGPTINLFGTDEQKTHYLPRIARGEIEFALGYTEPDAGSDLAAMQIRAVETEKCYIINGQKTFNTACHFAQYHWLGARTEDTNPRHKGISLFVVPMDLPGITIRPLFCFHGMRTNEVYYDNVEVPKENLVGQKNHGFYQIAKALELERIGGFGEERRFFDSLCEFLRDNGGQAGLARYDLTRQRMAEMAIELEAAYLITYRLAWMLDRGVAPSYEASMAKLFVSEFRQRLANTGAEVLGLYAQLEGKSERNRLNGRAIEVYFDGLLRTITGGTSEIQRNIISSRGLGLPRA